MKYIVSANARSIKTNKTNLASAIQTLIDEGYEKVTVQLEPVESANPVRTFKFKEGDRVRIVSNLHKHGFDIGQIVTIVETVHSPIWGTYYDAISENSGQWAISASECELIKSDPVRLSIDGFN